MDNTPDNKNLEDLLNNRPEVGDVSQAETEARQEKIKQRLKVKTGANDVATFMVENTIGHVLAYTLVSLVSAFSPCIKNEQSKNIEEDSKKDKL